MIDLTDRIVLITGAAGGIGSATARTLAAAGASLLIHDVNGNGSRAWPPTSVIEPSRSWSISVTESPSMDCGETRWRPRSDRCPREQRWHLSAGSARSGCRGVDRGVGPVTGRQSGGPRDPLPRGHQDLLGAGRRRDHHQHGQPCGIPRRGSRVLALRCREGRDRRDDADDRPAIRPRRASRPSPWRRATSTPTSIDRSPRSSGSRPPPGTLDSARWPSRRMWPT